jgi:proteasome accessory factor C
VSGARDQVGRLLALVPYIQARQEVSLEQAAAAFGVRPDQIVKDLNVLWFCGLPGLGMGDLIDVDMDAVEGEGVIRVSNVDYLRRPLRLDSSEAAALIVALRALRDGSTPPVRPIVDRTLGKLEAAAGDGAAVAAQVDLHLTGPSPAVAELRERLNAAVRDRRQVRIDYYVPARDESTARVVDPIRLVTAEGNDYLDAWCHLAEDQRLFRLDRISSADVLDTEVADHTDVRPRDLAHGIFQASPQDAQVTLLLEPDARWVAEYYPTDSAEEAAGGRLQVRLRAGNVEWLVRLLLRLGTDVKVLGPDQVSHAVHQAAFDALANYKAGHA